MLGLEFGKEVCVHWRFKVSIFKIMRVAEIANGVSTDKEDQGLSPGRKQQSRN